MGIRLEIWAAAVAVVASASLGSASPRDPVTIDDAALRQQIERRFETSPTLKNQDLTVSVDDSVATVMGVVATSALQGRALRLARVKGISRVENQIEVKAKDRTSGVEAVGDKTKAALGKKDDPGGRERNRKVHRRLDHGARQGPLRQRKPPVR
jgi:hypothetical protein